MDSIIETITTYVRTIDPTINNDELLDFVVADVVDRALIYTNRDQLVDQYELDLEDATVLAADYILPIPRQLERPLASVCIGVYKTVVNNKDADIGAVLRVNDNGQEVWYDKNVTSLLANTGDADLFSGTKTVLDRYLIAKVIRNENSQRFQSYYRQDILRQDN